MRLKTRSKNVWIFGRKLGASLPSRKTVTLPVPFLYFRVVVVAAALNVKLIDGLAGNWTGYFPQYLTRAMFDGLFQVTSFILYSKEILPHSPTVVFLKIRRTTIPPHQPKSTIHRDLFVGLQTGTSPKNRLPRSLAAAQKILWWEINPIPARPFSDVPIP